MTEALPPLRYLSAREVDELLPPIAVQMDLIRETLGALASGAASAPPLVAVHPRPTGFAHAMPAYSSARDLTSIKWISGDQRNRDRGLPYLSSLIVLNDSDTGVPTTILDGAAITAARTAAVSGVSIAALAPEGWSEVALVGYGRQALAHVEMLRALNAATMIRVATRRPPQGGAADAQLDFVGSPREAIEGADVVITGIPLSSKLDPPVEPSWLKQGALVLPIDHDASLSPTVANKAPLFVVDSPERLLRDQTTGLFAGWRTPDAGLAEVVSGRPSTEPGVVCVNQGIGLMDGPFADTVRRHAEDQRLGTLLER